MISSDDANLAIFLPLSETGYYARRLNRGAAGSAFDLRPCVAPLGLAPSSVEASTVYVLKDYEPLLGRHMLCASYGNHHHTSPLWGASSSHSLAAQDDWGDVTLGWTKAELQAINAWPNLPYNTLDGVGFAWGITFKVNSDSTLAVNTSYYYGLGGWVDTTSGSSGLGAIGAALNWNNATIASGAGTLAVTPASNSILSTGVNWTAVSGGAPATGYILPDVLYRLVYRVVNDGTTTAATVYVYLWGSDGTFYSWRATEANKISTDMLTNVFAATSYERFIFSGSGTNSNFSLNGFFSVADYWQYHATLSEDDATSISTSGIATSYEEPTYNIQGASVNYACRSERASSFPVPRALPTGQPKARHTVGVLGLRHAHRWDGLRPARPACLHSVSAFFDVVGPRSARSAYEREFPAFAGISRLVGQPKPGKLRDARNVYRPGNWPRTRRGFNIRSLLSTASASVCAFRSIRDWGGSVNHLYKIEDSVYLEAGTSAPMLLEAGWQVDDLVSILNIDGRGLVLGRGKNRWFDPTTSQLQPFGASAPASLAGVAGSGGTLLGAYWYAVTEYDPVSGDESGPRVVSAAITAATQKITLTIGAVSSDTRFTHRRIYRTTAGGAPPDLYLVAQIATSTTYADTGLADGTVQIGVAGTSYITSEAPDTFLFGCWHLERAFYVGQTDQTIVYFSEANEPQRFYANAYMRFDQPVTAIASKGSKLVVWTRNSTYIVESDFVRAVDLTYNIFRSLVSDSIGCCGHRAVVDVDDQLSWMDRRGAYRMVGDTPQRISTEIDALFPFINHSRADKITAGYSHTDQQIWFSVPYSSWDNTRNRAIFQYEMTKEEWWIHDLDASDVRQFDDGENGQRLGVIDHFGTFKVMSTYHADGVEGDESGIEATVSSISGTVITVTGSPGWTAGAWRGCGLALRDVSTGALYYRTIVDNGAATLTVEAVPSGLVSGDLAYVGGIPWYMETPLDDSGSRGEKVIREMQHQIEDLTEGELQ